MSDLMNIRDYLGVGTTVGGAFLGIGLLLLLAPYLPGLELGPIKIPQFSKAVRARLKWIGPLTFLVALVVHIPLLDQYGATTGNPPVPEPNPGMSSVRGPSVDTEVPGNDQENAASDPEPDSDRDVAQNAVTAFISLPVGPEDDPRDEEPMTTLEESGVARVMGVVTVKSRVSNIIPVEYFLEWVLVSGDQEILLTSYRDNEHYQFLQPDEQRISYWNVTKTIWTDNQGTYIFRVYRKDEEGTLVLKTQAELRVGAASVAPPPGASTDQSG